MAEKIIWVIPYEIGYFPRKSGKRRIKRDQSVGSPLPVEMEETVENQRELKKYIQKIGDIRNNSPSVSV